MLDEEYGQELFHKNRSLNNTFCFRIRVLRVIKARIHPGSLAGNSPRKEHGLGRYRHLTYILFFLKVLSNENRGGSKLVSIDPFL
jgi:hypothetical protein